LIKCFLQAIAYARYGGKGVILCGVHGGSDICVLVAWAWVRSAQCCVRWSYSDRLDFIVCNLGPPVC